MYAKDMTGGGPLKNTTSPWVRDRDGNRMIDINRWIPFMANEAIIESKTIKKEMSTLIEETNDAKQALKAAVEGIGENMGKIQPMKKEMIESLRGMRMTTTTEVAAMIKPLEDLRKFFLGAEHDKEVARLREFVDLCERLQKLKESGFLDSVADTMLKIA
jgi:hypothetical protein